MKKPLLAAVAFAAAFSARAELPAPVNFFSFDALDASGKVPNLAPGGDDLTLGAGASLTNLAAVGNALWFDGTQQAYALFRANAITNRTVSFWLYRSMNPGPYFDSTNKDSRMPTLVYGLNGLQIRFNNDWVSNDDHSLGIDNRQVVAWLGKGGTLGGYYFSYGKYPQVGHERWAHIVYAFAFKNHEAVSKSESCDTFDATIYIDGVKYYDAKDLVSTNCCVEQNVILGNLAKDGKRPCRAAIDEFKVFDCVLTDAQVQEEFARGRAAQRQRLVAWYPLQEFSEPDANGDCTTPDATDFGRAKGLSLTCSSATCVTNGPNGTDKAIHFDGTDTTHAFGRTPFALDDITVSAWVNISTNTSIIRIAGETKNFPKLFYIGTLCAYFAQPINNTQMQFSLPSGKGGVGGIHTFSNNAIAGKGNWQFLTCVVRNVRTNIDTVANAYNQHLELYINGELAQTGTDEAGRSTARNALILLGSDNADTTTRPFEGDVADFRIYDGAMSADDVKALFRGAAKVDAGADKTVKGAKAVLAGSVAAHGEGTRTGYAGDVAWSLVSAPDGGEGATILRPNNPVTEITLPVEGAYQFRLEVTGACGSASEDTVTLVRDDAQGETPAVPAVDLAAVTSNAALRAGLASGLIRHWSFNGRIWQDNVSGTIPNPQNDWSQVAVTDGVTGNGVGVRRGMRGKAFGSEISAGETSFKNGSGCPPDNEWLTVSAWFKPESDYPADWIAGVICHIPITLSVTYGKWYSPATATGPIPGMGILQTGIKGAQTWLNFDLPDGADLTDTWSHVTAVVNRWQTDKSFLYLNGVRLAEDTTHRTAGNYGTLTETNYAPFSGKPIGGRDSGTKVCFGDTENELGGVNNTIYIASNRTTHATYSRHFPGAIDEVRFYNRQLTEAEIAYLASHPDLAANAAPVVAKADAPATAVKKTPLAVASDAADDGNPKSALATEWVVLKGDAAKVVFADATARETTATFLAAGTYSLCLKATDGERTTYGEPIDITVEKRGLVFTLK